MGRDASFLREASIHQRRLKVLSEPCWIVAHHTALKPNLWWIPGDKVKALDPLPHTLRYSSSPIKAKAIKVVLGFSLSRYRLVRISQVPSLRWSSPIFPNVQSCSDLK